MGTKARRSPTASSTTRFAAPPAPPSSPASTSTTTGVLGNLPPDGGFGRFQALHGDNNLAVWLHRAGYYTAMVGKYLNGYANDPPVPRGWSEWYAAAPYDQQVYNYRLNENGTSVHYGQHPADFKQDVLTRKAVSFVNRRARLTQPFFLWVTYTAPHEGGWEARR